ncbi:MAG: helix-turn-helix transcriptional regulator [Verrucomicrobiota bacterium]
MCQFLLIKITSQLSDEAILEEIGNRLKRERLNRNVSQATLASEAGVSRKTITNIETGEGCSFGTLLAVLRVLDRLENMDAFLPDPGISPIQLAKWQGKQRQRASRETDSDENRSKKVAADSDWTWGDDE